MCQGCQVYRGLLRRSGSRKVLLFSAYCPLLIAAVKLFKTLSLLWARLQRVFHGACHLLLSGRDIGVYFRGNGGEDSRTECAALV